MAAGFYFAQNRKKANKKSKHFGFFVCGIPSFEPEATVFFAPLSLDEYMDFFLITDFDNNIEYLKMSRFSEMTNKKAGVT